MGTVFPQQEDRSGSPDPREENRASARKQQSFNEYRAATNDLASLIERAKASSACEIDHVITELQILREKLDTDGARVRHQLIEYTTFSESTLQSVAVISECLRQRFPQQPQS